MRILLILIIIAAVFVVVQSQRHGCKWGEAGWFDCVIGKSTTETPATSGGDRSTPPAPAPETPAPATPPAQ
jgi:hypothetical protein